MNKLILGDNTETIKALPANSVDAIITDSPYGLGKEPDAVKCLQDWIDHGYHEIKGAGFMGKSWDGFVPQPLLWKECFRVLKPGGYLLSFFGTRTYDWGTLAIRLAGFEIRDCIFWVYGSGFPKSLDISKAIDKAAGAERGKIKHAPRAETLGTFSGKTDLRPWIEESRIKGYHETDDNTPITEDAKKWNGYGTALKPACEPICVARKPLEGTVIENVLKWGVGGINIDAGRIDLVGVEDHKTVTNCGMFKFLESGTLNNKVELGEIPRYNTAGRWPANIIHDGSSEVLEGFPETAKSTKGKRNGLDKGDVFAFNKKVDTERGFNDNGGSAARFFYCAKASPAERAGRKHPTIKPLALMQYLVKVFCPEGGVCLDPHIGSGTTAVACIDTGRQFIGIDNDPVGFDEANKFVNAALWNDL